MRCLSGCASIAVAALAASALACAPAPRAPRPPGEVALAGVLRVEGADPFERTFVLVEPEGMRWQLAPGRLEHELYRLGGHDLRVFCRPAYAPGDGRIAVERYELLPVDGQAPVAGVIRLGGGGLWLETDAAPLSLEGELAAALEGFVGCRAWVWGERASRGARTPAISVAGYVVTDRGCVAAP